MAAEPTALSARACRQPDSKRSTFAHCAHLKASRAPLPVRRAQARLLTPRGQASDATGIRAHCVRYLTERRRQGSRIAWLATDPSKFDNLNRFVLTPFECWSVGERCTHCKRSGRECPLGTKRTWPIVLHESAFDPKQTFDGVQRWHSCWPPLRAAWSD